jgi:hypothetical protein
VNVVSVRYALSLHRRQVVVVTMFPLKIVVFDRAEYVSTGFIKTREQGQVFTLAQI